MFKIEEICKDVERYGKLLQRKDNITSSCYITIKFYEYGNSVAIITMSNGQYITITFSTI